VDFVREFSAKTDLPVTRLVGWIGIARGKYFDWRSRYGKANEHNAWSRVTTGSNRGSARRSSTTLIAIRSRVTAG
jgi:hypothetical protein